ncbi:hypothetical protein HAX54_043960 [Datura stramonium]|uniref:Maturase K n=1 Tax=Datura stramonium TaxID=4076 RepID=A0ABS8W597_DATST|nr:hypothetical protein [Datura stramonium]
MKAPLSFTRIRGMSSPGKVLRFFELNHMLHRLCGPNIDLLVDKTIVKVCLLLFSDDSKFSSSLSEKWEIYRKLQSLPRNSAPTRLQQRFRSSLFPLFHSSIPLHELVQSMPQR